ncbi:unnamed protein product [Phaeothamnion confervicola]
MMRALPLPLVLLFAVCCHGFVLMFSSTPRRELLDTLAKSMLAVGAVAVNKPREAVAVGMEPEFSSRAFLKLAIDGKEQGTIMIGLSSLCII